MVHGKAAAAAAAAAPDAAADVVADERGLTSHMSPSALGVKGPAAGHLVVSGTDGRHEGGGGGGGGGRAPASACMLKGGAVDLSEKISCSSSRTLDSMASGRGSGVDRADGGGGGIGVCNGRRCGAVTAEAGVAAPTDAIDTGVPVTDSAADGRVIPTSGDGSISSSAAKPLMSAALATLPPPPRQPSTVPAAAKSSTGGGLGKRVTSLPASGWAAADMAYASTLDAPYAARDGGGGRVESGVPIATAAATELGGKVRKGRSAGTPRPTSSAAPAPPPDGRRPSPAPSPRSS